MKIKLTAKTKKGKDRIKRWGADWIVVRQENTKILIVSEIDSTKEDHFPDSTRWIDLPIDKDFTYEEIN